MILWMFPILLMLFAKALFLIHNNADPVWASFILCLIVYGLESKYFKLDFGFVINDNENRIKELAYILFKRNNCVLLDTENEIIWLSKKCVDSNNKKETISKVFEQTKWFLAVLVFPLIILLIDKFKGVDFILAIVYILGGCFIGIIF